ncbi:MAG: hypothetical protein L6R48_12055, partial [Planctomycetes bacterium]|nr:hypothetical protein [Planctomycetota bacterium]
PGSAVVQHRDGVFACLGARVALLAGALGGRSTTIGALTLAADPCTRNHGALAVAALDGRPLAASRRLLVAAMAGSSNTGMKRKLDGTGIEDWGTAPVLVEPLTGSLDLGLAPGLSAWALDPGGAVRAPARLEGGRLLLQAEDRTVWYLVAEGP